MFLMTQSRACAPGGPPAQSPISTKVIDAALSIERLAVKTTWVGQVKVKGVTEITPSAIAELSLSSMVPPGRRRPPIQSEFPTWIVSLVNRILPVGRKARHFERTLTVVRRHRYIHVKHHARLRRCRQDAFGQRCDEACRLRIIGYRTNTLPYFW